jgi:hypothetical protein
MTAHLHFDVPATGTIQYETVFSLLSSLKEREFGDITMLSVCVYVFPF